LSGRETISFSRSAQFHRASEPVADNRGSCCINYGLDSHTGGTRFEPRLDHQYQSRDFRLILQSLANVGTAPRLGDGSSISHPTAQGCLVWTHTPLKHRFCEKTCLFPQAILSGQNGRPYTGSSCALPTTRHSNTRLNITRFILKGEMYVLVLPTDKKQYQYAHVTET
jgi:hypothetical protein